MRERTHSREFKSSPAPAGSFSWWTWRPGIAPIQALLIGLPLILLASLLLAVGLYTLILGIIDGATPPTQLSGVAISYSSSSASGNLPGSILLLLIGSLLLPYPLFLTFGGWHDLRAGKKTMTGKVVARRTTATNVIRQGRSAHPGMTHRMGRPWYGMALQPLETDDRQQVMVFRLTEEQYGELREGKLVRLEYTPHLHHVQSLKHQ